MHYGFLKRVIETTLVNGLKHIVIQTHEPHLSSHCPEIKETVLNKGCEALRLVPLTFGDAQFIGPETAVTDPTNKQRLIVIS